MTTTKETELRFYPGTHTYYKGSQKLVGVTTLIKPFFEEFDAKKQARFLAKMSWAKKQKKGVRYWLNEWKESAAHGSRTHQLIEDYINDVVINPECTIPRDLDKFAQAIKYLEPLKELRLETEKRIFNTKLGIAGSIDLLVHHEDGSVSVHDWKTNKSIDMKNKYTKGLKAKGVFSDLDDCSYIKYALQSCIYSYILELDGYTIRNPSIIHLMEDKYKEYPVEYEMFRPYIIELFKGDIDE